MEELLKPSAFILLLVAESKLCFVFLIYIWTLNIYLCNFCLFLQSSLQRETGLHLSAWILKAADSHGRGIEIFKAGECPHLKTYFGKSAEVIAANWILSIKFECSLHWMTPLSVDLYDWIITYALLFIQNAAHMNHCSLWVLFWTNISWWVVLTIQFFL